jgi:caffeoyl-CoA O-methyltransferase
MTETEIIDDYILKHIDPESDYLYRLYRATNTQLLRPRMAAGHLQGRLLKLLTTMIRPRNILEIGTYTGYSAICMAEGLTEGGKVYTFEINDEQEVFTRPWIEGSDVAERIRFIIGDALEMAPRLVMEEGVQFDMVYIDGDKKAYTEYYEMALSLMKSGGYIIADNTLWDGHVIDPAYDKEPQTVGVRTFNDLIAKDPRVEKVILPLRDGLTIAHIL